MPPGRRAPCGRTILCCERSGNAKSHSGFVSRQPLRHREERPMVHWERRMRLGDLNPTPALGSDSRETETGQSEESPAQFDYFFAILRQSFAALRMAARFSVNAERGITSLQPAACACAARSRCT